jgi:hypothetical protein
MPLPPAPTPRASLISNQEIAKSTKVSASPARQAASEIPAKKTNTKTDPVDLKADHKSSPPAAPAKVLSAEPIKKAKPSKSTMDPPSFLSWTPMC